MEREVDKKLSAEEAGAFVAQWAESQTVTLEDLSSRLGVEPSQVESLWRQAQGRLSMERWSRTQGGQTPKESSTNRVGLLILLVLIVSLGLYAAGRVLFGLGDGSRLGGRSQRTMGGSPVSGSSQGNSGNLLAVTPSIGQAGDAIGVSIARETMSGQPSNPSDVMVGAAMTPKGLKQSHETVTMTGTNPVDLTSVLKLQHSFLPDDVEIRVKVPHGIYVVRGAKKRDLLKAQVLLVEQLSQPIQTMLTHIMKIDRHPEAERSGDPICHVSIILGKATASFDLPWSMKRHAEMYEMVFDPKQWNRCPMAVVMLGEVRRLGRHLFE